MSRKRPQARPEQVPIPAKPDEASKEELESLESTPEVKSRHLCPTKHLEPLSLSILQSGPRSYVRCSVCATSLLDAPGRVTTVVVAPVFIGPASLSCCCPARRVWQYRRLTCGRSPH